MTTETDRELLELAARAAGIELRGWYEGAMHADDFGAMLTVFGTGPETWWNSLIDDGDALRLRTALMLDVTQYDEHSVAVTGRSPTRGTPGHYLTVREPLGDDPNAATRRAITRAAAEIGRAMK